MSITHPLKPLQRRWRSARMRALVARFGLTEKTRVLDVGGDLWNWDLVGAHPQLTILNLGPPPSELPPHATWLVGDGCALPFADQSFDIAYSNSVIEHLGCWERQQQFAREIQRVGREYYVQTPNQWFPVDQHMLTPFVHYLPHSWQRTLYPYTVWGMVYRPSIAEMDANFEQIRLLTRREVRRLFPDATILTERVVGIAKSYIAQSAT